jgi:hypothetical protein
MSLAHLDQTIELERGEAGQLWWAVADCGRRNLVRLLTPGLCPESAGVVVALPVLERVAKRLKRLDERELSHVGIPGRKPKKFRLKVDEVVAIMLYVYPRASFLAPVALGKVQQKSLTLESYITWP